jgi:hypothetical protein
MAGGVDREGRQSLCHIIVQFARKAGTLFLLRVDKAPAQFARIRLRSAALSLLIEQPENQGGLQKNEGGDYGDLQPLALP